MSMQIQLQTVSQAKGAWTWARTRGYFRVALVDTCAPHRRITSTGYLRTLHTSGSVCLDYAGGRWGYEAALRAAIKAAQEAGVAWGVPVAG